ncbi:MAG: hypothetical protein KDI37_06935 [Xanthomonadales bacterium]|nr:hypothetical protein [Xanthomonadales bacterium]MCB1635014.1 hypothetical protein [Xanthomonadales bacterium]MCB1641449.1 hypothetical protein [Xanthomonadales bacterium]
MTRALPLSLLGLLLVGCTETSPPPPAAPPPKPAPIQKAQKAEAVEQQVMDSKARLDEALEQQN